MTQNMLKCNIFIQSKSLGVVYTVHPHHPDLHKCQEMDPKINLSVILLPIKMNRLDRLTVVKCLCSSIVTVTRGLWVTLPITYTSSTQ